MKRVEDHPELVTDEARQGETNGTVRYVLVIGVVLALAGMFGAYLFH
jgi:hypothetical protein